MSVAPESKADLTGLASALEASSIRAERALREGLALRSVAIPPELARLAGTFRGARVTLEARAYRGPHTAYARVVRVSGAELEIVNVLCLSTPERALPILGVDLVALARDTLVAVADLSPLHPEPATRARQLAPLARRRLERPFELPAGELPAWCVDWFSPEALLTRVPARALPLVAEAVHAYVEAYVELARTSEPDGSVVEAVSAGQRGYARAHVEHDRGLGLLKKLFDPTLAERFLAEVLFPERTPAWP